MGVERPVRHTDRGEVEHGAEMEGEPRAARVVTAGRVDEQNVRRLFERTDGLLERRPFAQCEQAGLVRSSCRSANDDFDPPRRGRCPGGVPGVACPSLPAREADKAAADHEVPAWFQETGTSACKLPLKVDELLGRRRPVAQALGWERRPRRRPKRAWRTVA
jgi:hypothetical protein